MKQFYFYNINEKFKTILKKENLIVFYELLTRENLSRFEKHQIDLLLDKVNQEEINDALIKEFSNFNSFSITDEGVYKLTHNFLDEEERLYFKDKIIVLESNDSNSKFIKFMSLHFPSLLMMDIENKEISSLALVNI